MSDRKSLDIARLRAAYEAGATTPAAVMQDVLDRIAEAGADGVWIARRPDAEILEEAAALGGRTRLPLYGIPFAVKDNIDVAGLPTTAACPAFAYVPDRSSPVVERLIAAGAILVGKTNLDQFATGLVGTRSPYGVARNPFDAAMAPGGSSSGSAVAVSSGLVSFALGTDTAGSGRVPAAFNNIVGLKPTRGLFSTRGLVPACRSLDCLSIFALTVDDATAVAAIMMGVDAEDDYSRAAPPAFGPIAKPWRGTFRVGVPRASQLAFFGDEEARRLYEGAVARAAEAGGTIVEIDFAPWIETAGLLYGAWTAERTAATEPLLTTNPEAMHPVTRAVIARSQSMTAVEAFRAQYRLAALAQQIRPVWRDIDFLLIPTTGTAFTLEQIASDPIGRNTDLGFYTNFTNLLDLSAIAIPNAFTRHGFPVGVTLLAPAWHDGLIAGFARDLHRRAGTPLGATGHEQPAVAPVAGRAAYPLLEIAVFGAHLTGQPLNPELVTLGGVLRRPCRTMPFYRMMAIPGPVERPGLVHAGSAEGSAIDGEVWTLPSAAVADFLTRIAPPLGLGTVQLDGEGPCTGFVCENNIPQGAADISRFGSWRAYREAMA